MNAPLHQTDWSTFQPPEHDLPLGKHLTSKLYEQASPYFEGKGGCHGFDHSMRVHHTGLFIGSHLGARLDIISAAAILHDIGRKYEMEKQGGICHAEKGAELAEQILYKLQFGKQDIEQICHCIASHRYRDNYSPDTIEAKIIFDADKLDCIGATGIGRAFLFAGQVGARLHNPNCDIEKTTSYSIEDTAYREFRVKLCKVKKRMLTDVGKQLAKERHQFMEDFFRQLDSEIYGEWK